MQEMWVQSLGQANPLEEEMATHSSILPWRIPGREDPGGLQSMGSKAVQCNWAHTHTYTQIRNKGSFWKHELLRQVIITFMIRQRRIEAENSVKQQRIILKGTSLLSSFPNQQTLPFKHKTFSKIQQKACSTFQICWELESWNQLNTHTEFSAALETAA